MEVPELPPWVLWLATFVGAIAAALAKGAWTYLQRASREPEPAKQMVIERASVADIRPITEIRDDVRAMRKLMEEAAEAREEREREARMLERLERMQARRTRQGKPPDAGTGED
ncbi:hypothetical protein [Labrys sp. (in: a-proteobacteria)]|uniref:hypothetical protein n=1 Tax=Labrys sp. (in: a-proteobacteria) TaxID=1917972 RepID=UPI0039E255E7